MDRAYILDNSIKIEVIRGIYFLIDNEEIVYVGQSANIHQRISAHLADKEKSFERYFYIAENDNKKIDDLEASYIVLFNPKYNKNLPVNSLYIGERPAMKYLATHNKWVFNRIVKATELKPVFKSWYSVKDLQEIILRSNNNEFSIT